MNDFHHSFGRTNNNTLATARTNAIPFKPILLSDIEEAREEYKKRYSGRS